MSVWVHVITFWEHATSDTATADNLSPLQVAPVKMHAITIQHVETHTLFDPHRSVALMLDTISTPMQRSMRCRPRNLVW